MTSTTTQAAAQHLQPVYQLVVGGRNITPTIDPRLIDLTLTECRGDEADQLELRLSDHDGAVELPSKGVTISLQLGWAGQALVDKGTFEVDEVEHSGTPDVISIRARSADLGTSLRNRRDQSWHGKSLGDIITTIAKRHGLAPRVDSKLAAQAIAHIDQTNESDINFVTRLAKRYDAVATVKASRLLFMPITGTTTSKGEALPAITITRADGDQHRYHSSNRDAYSGVRAYYHVAKKATREGVLVGESGNAKRLRESYANEADALAAAKAEWQRIQRGAATLELTMAIGRPELQPQTPVTVSGFKAQIDGTGWLTVKVTHSLSDGGLTSRAEFETGEAANT
ncbi:phage late control D family protein [Aquabacterium sp.]|uniref:phage late control D family protein n=1 Tax=Aquabacterium sp. TaxID=1872578 RepID=UPI002609C1AF|nr:phage late control D family protein [Aquabacterium sp.]MDD2978237.1 phage late control D family protein [Aquabacterium sp.]